MSELTREAVLRFIGRGHQQLAVFARESHRLEGRGVVQVDVPLLPPGVGRAVVSTHMVYHTLDQIRLVTGDLEGAGRADADVVIRIIETYDPSSQAVVMAAFEGQGTITVKMKLDVPAIVDEVNGVH